MPRLLLATAAIILFHSSAIAAEVENWITDKPAVGSTLSGTERNDQIPDTVGGATLVGGAGDDHYLIADSGSKIVEKAAEGIDAVTAYTHFRLPAHVERLNLQGSLITGVAADTGSTLVSLGERNVLTSGPGDDELIDGTNGKQTLFHFDPGSGRDVIIGFTAAGEQHDLIRLNEPRFTSFAALKAEMRQIGSDVRIDLGPRDSILIRDARLSSLTADHFLLPFSPAGLKMTFNDEFDRLSLHRAGAPGVWKTSYPHGPSDGFGSLAARTLPANGELEIYVDPDYAGDPGRSRSALGLDPFAIRDGILSITATKLNDEHKSKLFGYGYASGLLTTEKTFAQTYGYFEMRAELPIEKGMFPAFWMLPIAKIWPPEIDIMENVGENWVSGGSIAPDKRNAFRTFFPEGLKGMHVYGLLWTPEKITWYVDGMAVGSVPTPKSMHQPMYLLVNLAVGGDWAGKPGADFSAASMKVDYVRAYSLEKVPNGIVSAAAKAARPVTAQR